MDETASPRVIVGVTGSLASLNALRRAVAEARARNAVLQVVHVCRVQPGDPAVMYAARESSAAAALEDIGTWLDEALGGPPAGVPLRRTSVAGPPPGPALVDLVGAESDLLVVGRSGRRLGLFWAGSVAAYCARRAACPVLVVPPPELAREFGGRTGLRRRIDRALAEELQIGQDGRAG
jgi:nucleotide-binding universal stress UspA family protein